MRSGAANAVPESAALTAAATSVVLIFLSIGLPLVLFIKCELSHMLLNLYSMISVVCGLEVMVTYRRCIINA